MQCIVFLIKFDFNLKLLQQNLNLLWYTLFCKLFTGLGNTNKFAPFFKLSLCPCFSFLFIRLLFFSHSLACVAEDFHPLFYSLSEVSPQLFIPSDDTANEPAQLGALLSLPQSLAAYLLLLVSTRFLCRTVWLKFLPGKLLLPGHACCVHLLFLHQTQFLFECFLSSIGKSSCSAYSHLTQNTSQFILLWTLPHLLRRFFCLYALSFRPKGVNRLLELHILSSCLFPGQ